MVSRRDRRRRALLGLAPREPEDGDEMEEKRETAPRPDKLARSSVDRRDGQRVEAFAGGQSGLMGSVREHRRGAVHPLNELDSSLTRF